MALLCSRHSSFGGTCGAELADLTVDPGHAVFAMLDVDRGVVGFVVDQQHRLLDQSAMPFDDRMLLQPFEQIFNVLEFFLITRTTGTFSWPIDTAMVVAVALLKS